MSPERTQAYRRVLQTLTELGPTKLQNGEQERIRYAADSLLFASDLRADSSARAAIEDTEQLCRALVDSGRWTQFTADRLAADVSRCGPGRDVELRAA